MGDAAMEGRESPHRLRAITPAFLPARDGALQSLELLERRAQMAWIGFACAIGEGGQRLDAQVHSHDWPTIHRRDMRLLDQDRDVPMPCLLRDRGGADRGRGGK